MESGLKIIFILPLALLTSGCIAPMILGDAYVDPAVNAGMTMTHAEAEAYVKAHPSICQPNDTYCSDMMYWGGGTMNPSRGPRR